MAELGDDLLISGGAPARNVHVTVEMMDYAYVDECNDLSTIRGILRKLKQEEKGRFPELERHVEQKLLRLLPEKERNRIMRLRSQPNPGDVKAAQEELAKWQESVRKIDAERSKMRTKSTIPPPRGKEAAKVQAPLPQAVESTEKGKRISGYDFQAWEKFDVDAAIEEIDETERSSQRKVEDAAVAAQRQEEERRRRRQQELDDVLESMRAEELSVAEASLRASREKQKGNECYRAGEIDEAHLFYTKALALLSLVEANEEPGAHRQQKAILYCNRAMTNIKLERLPKAEQDCDDALALDPSYLKARQRRGIIRHKRGKYQGAVEDFEEALRVDPNSKDVGKLLLHTRKKLDELGRGIDSRGPASVDRTGMEAVRTRMKMQDSEKENVAGEIVDIPVHNHIDLPPLPDTDAACVVSGANLEDWQGDLPQPRCLTDKEATNVSASGPEPVFHRVKVEVEDDGEDCKHGDEEMTEGDRHGEDGEVKDSSVDQQNGTTPPQEPDADEKKEFRRIAIEEASDSDEDEAPEKSSSSADGVEATSPSGDFGFEEIGIEELVKDKKDKGNLAVQSGDCAGGLEYFLGALALLPEKHSMRAPLHSTCCAAYLQLREYQNVVEHATKALEADESGLLNVKVVMRRAEALEELGRYSDAVSDLESVLEVDPDAAEAADSLRRCKAMLGKSSDEGPTMIATDLENEPLENVRVEEEEEDEDENDGHAGRGWRSPVKRSNFESSATSSSGDRLSYWKKKLSKSTSSRAKERAEQRKLSDGEKKTGNELLRSGDFAGAIDAYSTAIRLDPSNVTVLNNRAQAKLKFGDFEGAFDDADDVLREEPDNLKARYRRGLAAVELGKLEDAICDFKMVVSIQPNDKLATRAMEDAEQRLAQPSEGVPTPNVPEKNESSSKTAEEDDEQRKEEAEIAKNKGNALVAKGLYEEGIAAYTEALRLNAEMWVARNNRSQAYLKIGTSEALEKGMQDASDVLLVQPDNCKALYRRAFAALELAKSSADDEILCCCVRDLERLLELSPGNKAAQKALVNARKMEKPSTSAKARVIVEPTPQRPSMQENRSLPSAPVDPAQIESAPVESAAPQVPRPPTSAETAQARVPGSAPASANSASAMNERVRAAMRKALDTPRTASVDIPAPPKSLYEFERTWRGLKGNQEAFVAYLSRFSFKDFKRVIKESTDMEVYSTIFAAANAKMKPSSAVKILHHISRTDAFGMAKLMLSAEDSATVAEILRKAAEDAEADEVTMKIIRKCKAAYV